MPPDPNRRDREAAALRENLKRRKAQSRSRDVLDEEGQVPSQAAQKMPDAS